ncbi:MAG: serine/threonine protein kinase, partial [Polyangiaceae bacterium]|nr:serine/threonine protein kinase [Polyangiaceae bacterium]
MPADPRVGQLLDETYRIVRLLGRGGMGAVYEATQEPLGRRVALKLITGAVDPVSVARFRREAQSAAQLGHPNIVPVTDYREPPGGEPFLVMDLLPGRSLAEELRARGRLPAAEVRAIARQVLDALAAAHAAGVVHRDIKPANLMLVPVAGLSDVVKVLDFGVAHIDGQARVTQDGALVGTPRYMAPEQAFGGAVDARVDLYALGATLFHALTGRPPFDVPTVAAALVALRESPAPAVSSIVATGDRRLDEAVARCLAKDPAARFSDAESMRAFLEPDVRPQVPVAAPRRTGDTAPRSAVATAPRRRTSWTGLGVFAFVVA